MNFKIAFASATAIGLLMATGAAYAGSGNYSYLSQTGTSQTATITQSGGSNDKLGFGGPFIQENGTGTGHNTLFVNQNSNGGSGLPNLASFVASGGGNSATGWQSGSTNYGEIDQMGSNSSVNLQQQGDKNGTAASATWSNDNLLASVILQDATASGSSVTVHQSNANGADRGSIFSIGQGGAGNVVNATQTASSNQPSSARNDVWIRQGTTAPDLWGWTYGDFFSPSYVSGSLGTLTNSTITVNQNAGNLSGTNYAALGQGSGNANAMTVTQVGVANSATANQVGSNNVFNSIQTSSNGNTGWNFVGGEAGWPDSNPNPLTYNGTNPGDYRPVLQSGIGNEYDSTQSGSNLMAFGNQLGNFNFLSNTQSGDLNKLFSTQLGDSNTIYSVQSGDTGLTTVSQVGTSNFSNSSQNGSGNTATITQ